MISYLVRRLVGSIGVIAIVSILAFFMANFAGDPVLTIVGRYSLTEEVRKEIIKLYGFDKPIHVQYLKFVERIARGDFGTSFVSRTPAIKAVADRVPASVELLITATILAIILGIIPGVLVAAYPKSFISRFSFVVSLSGLSIPTFVLGVLMLAVFSLWLGWLPPFGRGDTVKLGFWSTGFLTVSGLKHLIMPSITLSFYQIAFLFRLTSSEMIEHLSKSYVQTARSKGLPEYRILFKHTFRNACKPLITMLGLLIGVLFGFSIITEAIFQWPGLGSLLVTSIADNDRPVIVTYLMFIAAVIVLANLAADLLQGVVDPRIRNE